MALQYSFDRDINQVLFEEKLHVKKVTLNRPTKLNSLTFEMLSQISKKLKAYENDSNVTLVILKGNGKAFCAGGDLTAIYKYITEGHWSLIASYFKKLLTVDYWIATYKKPLVAVGLHPNAAAPQVLSRLPGYFGEYLGLTGAQLNGAEMVACGLATHFVLSKDLQSLKNALDSVASSDTTAISQLLGKFVYQTNIDQDIAYDSRLKIVNECFCKETVEGILLALERRRAETGEEKCIVDAINSMKSSCLTSLKIFLRVIREDRQNTFEEGIIREYNIICHSARGEINNDAYEGLRSIFDKDHQKPKWQPSKLELVTEEMIDCYFSKVEDEDWEFLQLPTRSSFAHEAMKSKL